MKQTKLSKEMKRVAAIDNIPDVVTIAGKKYSVLFASGFGGKFNTIDQTIELGSEGTAELTWAAYVHELLEILLSERMHRYSSSNSFEHGDLLFVLTHKDFQRITDELAEILLQCNTKQTS